MKKRLVLVFLFIFVIMVSEGLCEVRCIDTEGEAVIVNNDIPSAKVEAIARAKWSAIEQTVGVEVKAESVVQNMALVDDAVSKEIKGIVTSHKTLDEKNRGDTFWVKVNACVEPSKAMQAMSSLSMNSSIAVFIPARKPKVVGEAEVAEYEETNILSETLIGKLTEQGYTVTDVAPTEAVEAGEIEKAIKSGNYLTLRSLMYKFLSNILLIGKVDYTVSTKKGEDVGYGVLMPFNNVTVRLTYRIVVKDPKTGKMVILSAGEKEGKGMAGNVEDATAKGHRDLAEKLIPVIMDKVSEYIKGMARRIEVKVKGITDIGTNFEIKDSLQNITWVKSVEEKGLGEFIVSYTENTIYLANSIGQKGNLEVTGFSPYAITINYLK
ncbi:MAG: hypothetical protein HY805_03860 [Nitrospirae bacterium]|nr:hypothetical protein [Nitrospirota bacterium]